MPRRKLADEVPAEPVEALPATLARRPRARRDRSWEADNPKATYRIPLALRDRVKAIAQGEGLRADDIARLALERFVEAYEAGAVTLEKHPRTGAFTLYPGET